MSTSQDSSCPLHGMGDGIGLCMGIRIGQLERWNDQLDLASWILPSVVKRIERSGAERRICLCPRFQTCGQWISIAVNPHCIHYERNYHIPQYHRSQLAPLLCMANKVPRTEFLNPPQYACMQASPNPSPARRGLSDLTSPGQSVYNDSINTIIAPKPPIFIPMKSQS